MEKFKIEMMSLNDLETIKDILQTEFDEFWTYEILQQELLSNNSKYIVAKSLDNIIVGFAGIKIILDTAELMNIVTKKSFRANGIGKLMLEYLINMCKKEKIKTLIKVEEEMGITLVHGAMTYECEECGKTWKMWLEIGVEGKDKVMPCPFIIRCKCGGMAKHINWQDDINLPEPRPLGENMSYFKLDRRGLKKKDSNACGIPVIK